MGGEPGVVVRVIVVRRARVAGIAAEGAESTAGSVGKEKAALGLVAVEEPGFVAAVWV